MLVKRSLITGALLTAGLFFISCDNFFSSSWGGAREYDLANIDVNAGNADEWVTRTKGDSDLAGKVTEKIKKELEDKVEQGNPTKDQAKLQDAGTKTAIESSNLGTAILDTAGKIAGSGGDMVSTVELLQGLHDSFKKNNGAKAVDNLCLIVSGSLARSDYNEGDSPRFKGLYADNASPEDVGQAVILLTLAIVGEVEGKEMDGVKDELKEEGINIVNGEAVVTGDPPSRRAVTLAAYLNLINSDHQKYDANPVTKGMREAFFP